MHDRSRHVLDGADVTLVQLVVASAGMTNAFVFTHADHLDGFFHQLPRFPVLYDPARTPPP